MGLSENRLVRRCSSCRGLSMFVVHYSYMKTADVWGSSRYTPFSSVFRQTELCLLEHSGPWRVKELAEWPAPMWRAHSAAMARNERNERWSKRGGRRRRDIHHHTPLKYSEKVCGAVVCAVIIRWILGLFFTKGFGFEIKAIDSLIP